MTTSVAVFEAERGRLFGLAYRMLGSAADAEDTVQDTFLRWHGADQDTIKSPAAWLTKATTNLCLNRLDSAWTRRERTSGVAAGDDGLPEPVPTATGLLGPLESAELRDSVSFAVLVLMGQLTPVERAVFVLREAFGYEYADIAELLDISPANSRQLHSRARKRIDAEQPVVSPANAETRRLAERFIVAARAGELAELERVLAEDVELWLDAGPRGRRRVRGRDRVGELALTVSMLFASSTTFDFAEINGMQAILFRRNGELVSVSMLTIRDGQVIELRTVGDPAKLAFANARLRA